MGYRSSWIAVEKPMAQKALKAAELRPTGELLDQLDVGWLGLELDPWYVVLASGYHAMDRLTERQAQALSTGGRAIFWWADDSTMCARMVEYRDGERVWCLDHKDGVPTVTGEAPAAVSEALARQREEQEAGSSDVDYIYDTAHIVGKVLVGLRHDEEAPPEGSKFIVLRPADEPNPTRIIETHGPFSVEFVLDPSGRGQVKVEATEPVTVERFVIITFADGAIQDGFEAPGGTLGAGDHRAFYLQNAETELTVVTNGPLGVKAFKIRHPQASKS